MSLSRELSHHLTNEDNQPLPKRLKLAENAFINSDLMLSRKEDIIINWLCEVSIQSNDISAWQTLKRCLEFQHIHSQTSSMKAPVKAALVETLMDGLKTIGKLELTRVIVSCYQSILHNREMQRYFIHRPIIIVGLLEQLLSNNLNESHINFEDGIGKLPELHECIIDSLNVLIECHRRLTNKTELRNDVIERLVCKLCIFSEKIASDKVASTLMKFIQRFIFDKSIDMKAFESENWAQELFVALSKHTADISNDNDITLVIGHIFHAAILSFKSSAITIDMIYRRILNCTPSSTVKIYVCGYLFRYFNDITLDIQNEIDKTTLTAYYHGIIDEILALDCLNDGAYNCLDGMAKFNPLIVESKLPDIFKKILLIKKSTDVIKSSYVNLMCDILDACIRLRRENKLVPWILMALDESLHKIEYCRIDTDDILPLDFTIKFTASINNMTNALASDVLMSFIYHLDKSSSQSPESDTLATMMEVSSRLIIAFLDGIHIFDHSTPPAMQRKFVDGLVKLGTVLEKLAKLVSPINKYETISLPVLSVVNCWYQIVAFAKNYAPESLTEENKLSICQIIEVIHRRINKTNSKLAVNNNISQLLTCCQLEKNRIDRDKQFDVNEIFVDIENNWTVLMDKHPYIIENFDDSQLSSLARVILSNVYNTKTRILQTSRIKSRFVQTNKKLTTALIFEIFVAIASKINNTSSTTNNLLREISAKNSLDDKRTGKILKIYKKLLHDPQWVHNKYSISIARFLEIILMLPLIHHNVELKTIIFLVVFSMTKEWPDSPDIIDLCYRILTDISEDGNIDILQYINIQYFIEELLKHSTVGKVLECSLRNISNYDSIAAFIKCHKSIQDCAAPTLIECIEKIKPRLKPDDKIIAKKLEKKLCKRILTAVKGDTNDPHQLRSLRIAFKAAVTLKKIDESMLDAVQSILNNIFQTNDKDEEHPKLQYNFHHDDELINEGLQIIKILLQPVFKRNDRVNQMFNKDIVKRTWSIILTKPFHDIVPDLLDAQRTTPKILKRVLNLLEKQTIAVHNKHDELLFENYMKIWSCLSCVDMPTSSNHIRQLYLQEIMRYFDSVTLSNDDRLGVLKLCTTLISSKRIHITEKTIDLMLLTAENFLTNLESISASVCDQILAICLAFVTYRVNIITDRLPALLSLYRRVIRFIIEKSKYMDNSCTKHQLQCLTLNANKLVVAFVKLKKDMSKLSPYIIADLIEMYSEGVIPAYVKGPLDDCIGMFLSNCDHHAIPLLFRALPSAMQEIFKTLYDTYTKFYKFAGKI